MTGSLCQRILSSDNDGNDNVLDSIMKRYSKAELERGSVSFDAYYTDNEQVRRQTIEPIRK